MIRSLLKRIPGTVPLFLFCRWLALTLAAFLVKRSVKHWTPDCQTNRPIFSVPFVNIVGEAFEHWHYTKLLGRASGKPVYCISPSVFPSDTYLPFLFEPSEYEFFPELYQSPWLTRTALRIARALEPATTRMMAHLLLEPIRKKVGAFEFFKSGYSQFKDPIYMQIQDKQSPAARGYVQWRHTANTFNCCQDYMKLLTSQPPIPIEAMPGYRWSEQAALFVSLGITKPFVCVHMRPYANEGQYVYDPEKETDPRSIRSFEPYLHAIHYLTACGYQVVRMGIWREVRPIGEQLIPGYIDYASSPYQTPKNDLYLSAKCAFYISAKSGPEIIALAFRRPVLGINYNHFPMMFTTPEMRWYPRPMVDREGRQITIKELLNSEFYYSYSADAYNRARVRTGQISSAETLDAVKEFLPLVENPKTDWRARTPLQEQFRKLLRPEHLDLYLAQGSPLDCYLRTQKVMEVTNAK